MSEDHLDLKNVSTYVISPGELVDDEPETVGEGQYIARLANEGVGNPSYALVPFVDGQPADKIRVGDDGAVYDRTLVDGAMVMYRSRSVDSAHSWSARG
jgi:hypothetical protein